MFNAKMMKIYVVLFHLKIFVEGQRKKRVDAQKQVWSGENFLLLVPCFSSEDMTVSFPGSLFAVLYLHCKRPRRRRQASTASQIVPNGQPQSVRPFSFRFVHFQSPMGWRLHLRVGTNWEGIYLATVFNFEPQVHKHVKKVPTVVFSKKRVSMVEHMLTQQTSGANRNFQ